MPLSTLSNTFPDTMTDSADEPSFLPNDEGAPMSAAPVASAPPAPPSEAMEAMLEEKTLAEDRPGEPEELVLASSTRLMKMKLAGALGSLTGLAALFLFVALSSGGKPAVPPARAVEAAEAAAAEPAPVLAQAPVAAPSPAAPITAPAAPPEVAPARDARATGNRRHSTRLASAKGASRARPPPSRSASR